MAIKENGFLEEVEHNFITFTYLVNRLPPGYPFHKIQKVQYGESLLS